MSARKGGAKLDSSVPLGVRAFGPMDLATAKRIAETAQRAHERLCMAVQDLAVTDDYHHMTLREKSKWRKQVVSELNLSKKLVWELATQAAVVARFRERN